ncbi:hypothetical protein OBBRIDRAFT_729439 [Obba rivulosa]|uniref:U6 snRNA phosphodiesterase 1 n=1 Tax=Obba rivulosa TaxID=1052685 RepID=A0A8E2AV31_9APHY|nr:hypothetical protein OBBRIDRAFT_729439 [Obba rivulosa]
MKRVPSLVPYGSSDEEEPALPPPQKKRKLPALPSSLAPQRPVDNPALHQGRVRTTPHVEGQFAAYVYVPLRLDRGTPLSRLLDDVFAFAKDQVPSLHPIGVQEILASTGVTTGEHELHISLTRPVYLRAHQREGFKNAVRAVARAHSTFTASFAAFAELTNDERTRTFLAVEIGAGHSELKAVSDALVPTLRSLRQKEFYSAPRFHASIAWALLADQAAVVTPPSLSTAAGIELDSSTPLRSPVPTPDGTPAPLAESASETQPQFLGIPHFPRDLVQDVNKRFGARLVSRQTSIFQVDEVCVRIGKEVSRFKLG